MSKNLQIEWVSFPAVENLRKTTIATIFIIGLSILLYFLYGPIYGFLSILFLGFSLLPYYTPTTYRLNEDGIEVKKVFYTIKKSWSNFRSFYPDKNGDRVKSSTYFKKVYALNERYNLLRERFPQYLFFSILLLFRIHILEML